MREIKTTTIIGIAILIMAALICGVVLNYMEHSNSGEQDNYTEQEINPVQHDIPLPDNITVKVRRYNA